MNDPQMQARGGLSKVKDRVGEYWEPNAPFQMPGLATHARPHVPELGESTVELLVGLLGYTEEQAKACSGEPVAAH
jgi:crotonobetainyl-CoA:carnitine CoA-transferase CaiB-like acyl-CoA transferase